MSKPTLAKQVDTYIENLFIPNEKDFDFVIQQSKKHNLPPIEISPVMGKFLYLLAKINNAKSILELGTLGGYSTLWLAKALPKNGKLVTIELQESHAAVAKNNFIATGFDKMIEIKIGPALELLPKLNQKFDFFFIDAHKEEYREYVEQVITLSNPGTVIICDNVIRNGSVLEEKPTKEYYKKLKEFNIYLSKHPKLESTILPLLLPFPGRDYLDGLSISIVT